MTTETNVLAELAACRELLAEAAALFRSYESHHRGKIGEAGRPEKAERNADIAQRIENRLAGNPA